ncbi:hypothetical protein ACE3MZ_16405 [Paenibacillus sp. WLX1005]|uniref:hypothetical protein n=1 Tax=Paenibacillus sp. WLX1005 TaxID=3243766 RepID=UPI003983EA9A
MIDFVLSNLYIVVIIAFAIFTAISSRSGKSKNRRSNPGMPTFGGGPMNRQDGNNRPTQPHPWNAPQQESEEEAQRRYQEAQRRYDMEQPRGSLDEGTSTESPTYSRNDEGELSAGTSGNSREGSRSEYDDRQNIGRNADDYRKEMQQRLDQLNNVLGERTRDMTDQPRSTQRTSSASQSKDTRNTSAEGLKLDADQATQGVLWAEILSAPRSRQAQGWGRINSQRKPS